MSNNICNAHALSTMARPATDMTASTRYTSRDVCLVRSRENVCCVSKCAHVIGFVDAGHCDI